MDRGNCYIILIEGPGLCVSNIDFRLNGRELAISSRSPRTTVPSPDGVTQTIFTEHRIRLPGPIVDTGPPSAESLGEGRLRVMMRKAVLDPETDGALSRL